MYIASPSYFYIRYVSVLKCLLRLLFRQVSMTLLSVNAYIIAIDLSL